MKQGDHLYFSKNEISDWVRADKINKCNGKG